MADKYVSVEQLIEAGAHFGHLTRRWNPKMKKYIFGERNKIHIIDVRKTQILVNYCREVIQEIAAQGQVVLFVGTKTQARSVIAEQASRAGVFYVSERWLGGMLTNFSTIRRSIARLNHIDKMEADGTFEKITKKERLLLTREKDRLRKVFGGIETMTRIPGAIFVVDAKKEHLAVKEAKILGIPVIGMVDTNTDPDVVDFPIPANDDSVKAIEVITSIMADAVIEGSSVAKVRLAELKANQVRFDKETEFDPNAEVKTSRRTMRERRDSDNARRGGGYRREDNKERYSRPNTAEKENIATITSSSDASTPSVTTTEETSITE